MLVGFFSQSLGLKKKTQHMSNVSLFCLTCDYHFYLKNWVLRLQKFSSIISLVIALLFWYLFFFFLEKPVIRTWISAIYSPYYVISGHFYFSPCSQHSQRTSHPYRPLHHLCSFLLQMLLKILITYSFPINTVLTLPAFFWFQSFIASCSTS